LHPYGWLQCLRAWGRLRDEIDRCSSSARQQRSATCQRRLSWNQSRDGEHSDTQSTTDQRGERLRVRPQRFDRRQQNRRQPFISAPSGRPARALDPVERLLIGRREHAEVAVEQPVADRALQHSSTEVRVKAKEPCATGHGTGDWAQEILVRASSPLLLRMTFGGIGSNQTRDQISG
jgi:hypothetical protein